MAYILSYQSTIPSLPTVGVNVNWLGFNYVLQIQEMVTIENELETEKKVVSAENKAAAALDKLLTDQHTDQDQQMDQQPPVQESILNTQFLTVCR